MLLSIVIPVFNAENRLPKTIHSILVQLNKDIELILINDGSHDKSGEICEYYAKQYENIKVFHQVNSGPSKARNRGIMEAEGDYLTFIDSDDEVDKHFVDIISNRLVQDKPDFILTGYKAINEYREKEKYYAKILLGSTKLISDANKLIKLIPELISQDLFNPLWNKVYKTKIIKDKKIKLNTHFSLGEDLLFNLEYIQYAKNMIIINRLLYYYNKSQEGLTHSYNKDKFFKLKPVTLNFKTYLERYELPIELYYQRLIRNIYSSMMELFHHKCPMSLQEKKTAISLIKKDSVVQELIKAYKPQKLRDRLLLNILKIRNNNLILVLSKVFYIKKFILAK